MPRRICCLISTWVNEGTTLLGLVRWKTPMFWNAFFHGGRLKSQMGNSSVWLQHPEENSGVTADLCSRRNKNFFPTSDLLNREEKTQIVLTFIRGSAITDCVLECGWGPSALLQRMAIALCVTQAVCETFESSECKEFWETPKKGKVLSGERSLIYHRLVLVMGDKCNVCQWVWWFGIEYQGKPRTPVLFSVFSKLPPRWRPLEIP